MVCPQCRATIVRHPLSLDFSEDLNIFRNIQEHAEAILAANYNQNNTANNEKNSPNGNNENGNNENGNNENGNNESVNNENQGADEVEEVFEGEIAENVRYELPSEQQVNFLRRFRQGQLNVRLGRRLLITVEGSD